MTGAGKIPQFLFAMIISKSNPNAIIISLLIDGIAEGETYQSSDVMEHLKTGHLVGASPTSLFYGQMTGSTLGAIRCSCVYNLLTSAYAIPSDRFTAPHAQLWLASAHLAYGSGLPPRALGFAAAGFILSAMCAITRIACAKQRWSKRIPSGIAIGIGKASHLLREHIADFRVGIYILPCPPYHKVSENLHTLDAVKDLARESSR